MASESEGRRRAPRIKRDAAKSKIEKDSSFVPTWRPGMTDKEMHREIGPVTRYDDPT